MHIVAESGSTKTDWCMFHTVNGTEVYRKSEGINPFFSTETQVFDILKQTFSEDEVREVASVHFYGPGTSQAAMRHKLENCLRQFFAHAAVSVDTDLTAAGRATLTQGKGLACILGTGSHCGIYDKGQIISVHPSPGYIFGDEGSGSYIGKQLISDYLNDTMPPIVRDLFNTTYNIGYADIITNVYSKPFPNRYLASFTHFVYNNRSITYCRSLVDNAFDAFFEKRILKFEKTSDLQLTFCGSVAYAFSDLLVKVAHRHGFSINPNTDVVQSPVEGLVKYHRMG